MQRLSNHTRAALGGVLVLTSLAGVTPAQAATERWSQPTVQPTAQDGLYLGGAHFDAHTAVRTATAPMFTFNGERYTFEASHRVGEVVITEAPGLFYAAQGYEVPVDGGTLKATLSYALSDTSRTGADAGQLSAWVDFSGPVGDYAFFWRMDLDVGSMAGNLVQIAEDEGPLRTVTAEQRLPLEPGVAVEVVDTRSFLQGTRLTFLTPPEEDAWLHVARFNPGELHALSGVVNGERTDEPGDQVIWYETRFDNTGVGFGGADAEMTTAYRVNAIVEQDKMTSAPWLDTSAYVYGVNRSIQSGFATANINITNVYRSDSALPDDSKSSDAELHSLMVGNKDYESQDSSSNWYAWLGMVLAYDGSAGVLGIMFDDAATNVDNKPRQGCAVFASAHGTDSDWPSGDTAQAEMILSATHELGHVYNQHHEDFCPTRGWLEKATFKKYSAIMGYAFNDTGKWTFGWNSVDSMTNDPEEYVRPGHGQPFTSNGQYTGYDDHISNHSSTLCRRFCCR